MVEVPRVMIVGAGFGGLNAAKGLKRARVRVTVIDKNNHHLFQPLLYQVATAGLSPADIASPIRGVLHRQLNTEILMAEVTGVDTVAKTVRLADRSIGYDYLIIATGAKHSYFGRDDWETHAPGLKSIEDATLIRRKILTAFEMAEMAGTEAEREELLTFVIVGGGPTGVEMAGSIAELARTALASDFRHIDPAKANVILVEAGPRVLATFDEKLSRGAEASLRRLGVDVRTSSRVEAVDANGVVISGARVHAKTVVWAAGVVASPAGRWLGARTDKTGRVEVMPDLSVPGLADVFVIGDAASLQAADGVALPGVAPVAMQQGKYVATLIAKRVAAGTNAIGPFRYFDKGNMATIGRSNAIVQVGRARFSGFLAWLAWLFVHVLYIVGFRNRLLVLIQWTWAYVTFQRGARLITREGCILKP